MSTRNILPQAEDDVLTYATYLSLNAALGTDVRFLRGLYAEVGVLASTPGMGIPCHFQRFELATVRRLPVRGFEKILVFYRPVQGGIEVVRVLHASRDWGQLFS